MQSEIIAIQVADGIDLRQSKTVIKGSLYFAGPDELFYRYTNEKLLSIFKHGVICFLNFTKPEQDELISALQPFFRNPLDQPLNEGFTVETNSETPVIGFNKITIPNMMLQPYIENAIWHGLSHKKGEKNLFIKINKKGNGVICKVEDNGVGRKMSSELKSLYRKEHRSRGMELLSKRFILLSKEFGADIQTNIEDLHDNDTATGTRVAITLPPAFIEKNQPVYSWSKLL